MKGNVRKDQEAKKILIVDDDPDIITLLKYNLEKEGYCVLTAADGMGAMIAVRNLPDLVLLDIMLPGADGWEIARQIKSDPRTGNTPIMFLTAKISEADEVTGLRLGAVDYLTKPIRINKLLARIESALRLTELNREIATAVSEPMRVGPLTIDPRNYSVRFDGTEIRLAKKEFEILSCLAAQAGRVVSRKQLIAAIWRNTIGHGNRSLDVHITRIRQKLGKYGQTIETFKRVGYRLRA